MSDDLKFERRVNEIREYSFNGVRIPDHMATGLARYLERRIPTGSFLEMVLSNNLIGALSTADDKNIMALPAYGAYLYNKTPIGCYGSPEAYKNWLADK